MSRKKWATALAGDKLLRQSSEPAVYRYLKDQAGRVNALRSPIVTIWVDEGDGQGWTAAAKHGQHIDDCHSHTERTVG